MAQIRRACKYLDKRILAIIQLFWPIGLTIFMGTQETIIYRLVMINVNGKPPPLFNIDPLSFQNNTINFTHKYNGRYSPRFAPFQLTSRSTEYHAPLHSSLFLIRIPATVVKLSERKLNFAASARSELFFQFHFDNKKYEFLQNKIYL